MLTGAAENNLALTELELDRATDAIAAARTAIGRDPQSPVYLQTLAYAYVSAGHFDTGADTYRQALSFDPTLFPAANDLGVVLARLGHTDEALRALRQAVGAKPDYALGWFNLGVLLSGMGPENFLPAQGALGRAAQLDNTYRGADRELSYDAEPYFSGLDISRPLPSQWRFAQHERRAPATLSLVVLLLLLGRFAWSAGLDQLSGRAGEKALHWAGDETMLRPRWRRVMGARIAPMLAVLFTVALLAWPLVSAPGSQAIEVLVLGAGVLALVGVYMRSRIVAGYSTGARVRHYSWLPALAFGTVMAGVGLAFAPVPAADTTIRRGPLRWTPLVLLAVLAGALLALGWRSGVPVTRALGASALVMISSILLPARPYDGAFVTSRITSLVLVVALLAVSALVLFGLI